MTPLVEQAEEYADPLADDLRRVVRRACEQVQARTGLQVRYDASCQPRAWAVRLKRQLGIRATGEQHAMA